MAITERGEGKGPLGYGMCGGWDEDGSGPGGIVGPADPAAAGDRAQRRPGAGGPEPDHPWAHAGAGAVERDRGPGRRRGAAAGLCAGEGLRRPAAPPGRADDLLRLCPFPPGDVAPPTVRGWSATAGSSTLTRPRASRS